MGKLDTTLRQLDQALSEKGLPFVGFFDLDEMGLVTEHLTSMGWRLMRPESLHSKFEKDIMKNFLPGLQAQVFWKPGYEQHVFLGNCSYAVADIMGDGRVKQVVSLSVRVTVPWQRER
ncbi:MAG: hypothetical protein LBL84_00960 [Candidatus Nomurabacteria bacterium]|jgi:hypothetical protein|nr:hypothetical protein [Candidatus Nomurabacteria bacterium]